MFAKGNLVLVPVSNGVKEVGTVLEVNCPWTDDEGVERLDGILVKTTVSRDRRIYDPTKIERWNAEKSDEPNERKIRVTRSRGAVPVSGSCSATTTTTTPPSSVAVLRSIVTPSPISATVLSSTTTEAADEDEGKDNKKPPAKRKLATTTVSARGALKKNAPPVLRVKRASKKADEAEQKAQASPVLIVGKPKKKNVSAVLIRRIDSSSSDDDEDNNDRNEGQDNENNSDNDDDNNDKYFTVEYASSGRATCRRCDEVITKGSVRVSHVPLFRGKPGFRVYRHLNCAVFDGKVNNFDDVGGWRKLNRADRDALQARIQASILELQQEEEELQPDELVQESYSGELRKPPIGLSADLLPFQVEGSSWMYCQEVNVPEIRGGILADEMGMGKTLQTIVTFLDNRPMLQHCPPGLKHPPLSPDFDARQKEDALWKKAMDDWKQEMDMINIPPSVRPKKLAGARAGTLVICPVVALSQWKSELEKFTENSAGLSIGIYHGPKRCQEIPAAMMQKYDVVLTTYQVLEQDYRRMISPNKVACPNCGGKFKIDKLRIHLKYFCGEGAQRTEAQMRQQRTADRRGRPGGGSTGGGKTNDRKRPSQTSSKSSKKAKTVTMTPEPKGKTSDRKSIRVKSSPYFESDSELSLQEDSKVTSSRGRPKRSAATKASKQVRTSLRDWSGDKTDEMSDESSFESDNDEDNMSQSESSSDGAPPMTKMTTKKGANQSKGDAVKKALEKQRKALETVSKKSKKTSKKPEKKKLTKDFKKKPTKVPISKGKESKKFDDESPDDSSGEDDDDSSADPLEGIDMDELVQEAMAGSRFSVLHGFCWWRVVLDEAHMIKSRASQTAAAAFSLTAIHRWCLSGTPLQNRVSELYSLIRFLRIDPMAQYFCRQKDCSCKSLHYRMLNGVCQGCGHRSFSHFAHFNKHVLNPIQRDGYSGDGRRAMFKLKNEVLDKCLLRRTKATKAADLALPPRLVTLRSIRLHPIEEDFYNALYTQTKSSFDDYVAAGTLLNNYAHIFDLLTKMRQAVNHPYLIVYSKTNVARNNTSRTNAPIANGSVDCDICHEPPTDRVLSSCCGGGFCRSCVIDYISGAGGEDSTPCPSCESPFTIDLNQTTSSTSNDDGVLSLPVNDSPIKAGLGLAPPSLKTLSHVATGSILRRINLAEFSTSTKIEVLIQELIEMRQQRPGSKALVFSQFVNMLDLVRWRLHSDPYLAKLDLGVRILHGGMDVKSRDAALKSFREEPGVRVLLMSLKSAGVALNLTAASEVYLLDLWWNPAAEMQALDRVHRIGQHRPIRAVRFVAEGTVEERVLQLQEKKRLVFDGTVGRDAGSLKMLTAQDMKALFT